jgi:hypothetical protein
LGGTHGPGGVVSPARGTAELAAIGKDKTMGLILLILLILMLVGGLPTWPYSRGWGYRPTGILGILLLILLILLLLNVVPRGF